MATTEDEHVHAETSTDECTEIQRKNRAFAAVDINTEDYDELLKRHLEDVDALQRKRLAEKRRLDDRLQDKLARKKAGQQQVLIYLFIDTCKGILLRRKAE